MDTSSEFKTRVLLKKAQNTIRKMKLSMMAHPDHTEGSEFDDYTTNAQIVEEEIHAFLEN